ncbi:hypothetical protein HXX76_016337 [Chlamydomonas incerta]|uniref:CCHC-type domain-containing protein n=1 Tax=Chlamydomonas incerta TaxID=51695 RepID=A0A835SEN9_CHLIN|nr:hypothetical protein HXX76_016337 [Chlamydomonas incerta]|eukprot:KAG2421998.1 hypothetical protein HXX76_016337 [Chlamydomonas incerta]
MTEHDNDEELDFGDEEELAEEPSNGVNAARFAAEERAAAAAAGPSSSAGPCSVLPASTTWAGLKRNRDFTEIVCPYCSNSLGRMLTPVDVSTTAGGGAADGDEDEEMPQTRRQRRASGPVAAAADGGLPPLPAPTSTATHFGVTEATLHSRREAGVCYACGQPGHMAGAHREFQFGGARYRAGGGRGARGGRGGHGGGGRAAEGGGGHAAAGAGRSGGGTARGGRGGPRGGRGGRAGGRG